MKRFALLMLSLAFSHSLNAVTVADAGAAYGKLNASILAYTAAVNGVSETQAQINDELKKELTNSQALNNATLYNVQQYKILSGVSSFNVNLEASSLTLYFLQNNVDLFYSEILQNDLIEIDIKKIIK